MPNWFLARWRCITPFEQIDKINFDCVPVNKLFTCGMNVNDIDFSIKM